VERRLADLIRAGRVGYAEAWAWQKRLLEARIRGEVPDTCLLVEHDPVYTVGRRRGARENVRAPGEVPVIEVERGGDVTFHGPGQIVVYPIVALEGEQRDLHRWLRRLEALVIEVLDDFGLEGARDARGTGAWVGGRKVASIGIACRRWVTWHGLALNVNMDLSWLTRINPCGMDAGVYTTMAALLGRDPGMSAVEEAFARRLADW
jgi:lipoate-protein ligase B